MNMTPRRFGLSSLLPSFLLSLTGFLLMQTYTTVLGECWYFLNTTVFRFFNERLVPGTLFFNLVAVTNLRFFDLVSFGLMGGLYGYFYLKEGKSGRRSMIGIGLAMLLTALLIKQCDNIMPFSNPSPTLVLDHVNRLSELTSWPAKDASRNSFPGDHGMMLMIFAAYLFRYFGLRAFLAGSGMVVILSLPRIAGGAHWFGDIYAGSLATALIILPWVLLTPLSDVVARGFNRLVPARLYRILGLA